ncbi:hypothetical protein DIC66_17150 [Rhodoferax lacus]|uniref:PAS domain S-box protein n=1 Tax=Rhodoferax lacus TaxID=2184758 RepID=A0A3E1RAP0_9BURK|nr:ATP-binding protein [Rhodoferax lacus]RFO95720.1 hypothetical protein DIC66_17150 [Rhodoferax lacus]
MDAMPSQCARNEPALVHLRAQQEALQTQNAALRTQATDLETSQARYLAYYECAPVGHVTLSPTGQILEANLTTATLLGIPRQALLGRKLPELVCREDKDSFQLMRLRALELETSQSCDLRMTHAAGDDWWANITLVLSQDAAGHPMLRTVLSDVGERKRMETMRLALSLRVEELSHSLVLGQEEARRRFSRELHDRTSPNLAALRINLDLITTATPQERASRAYADRIEDTRALLEDTTVSVRDICSELHPPVLDAGGLLSVVQNYVLQFSRRFGLQVHLHCPHGDMRLKPDLEISLFRILQEALTNCAKHASATVVLVNLQLDVVPMLMSVHDNGIGFNQNSVELTAPGEKGGHGLRNMKETAEFIGGRFTLSSVPGKGTRALVQL